MSSLLSLGRIMPLDELSAELKRRIEARGLGPPRLFSKWAEQILVDHPECKGLVLDGDQRIADNVEIDYQGLLDHGVATVAVLGNLDIEGRLINADSDGGPFLFVDGNLTAQQIEKGGAGFIVLGSVACAGIVFCDYNHGAFLVGSDLSAEAIITCDQELHAGGEIKGRIVSEELGNMREMLVAEVFDDPDDPGDEFADGSLIRQRLAAGLPVLRAA